MEAAFKKFLEPAFAQVSISRKIQLKRAVDRFEKGVISIEEYNKKVLKIKTSCKRRTEEIRGGYSNSINAHPAYKAMLQLHQKPKNKIRYLASRYDRGKFKFDGVVYFAKIEEQDIFKIGFTTKPNPEDRMEEWKTGCPFNVRMAFWFEGSKMIEGELHKIFKDFTTGGREWFNIKPLLLFEIMEGFKPVRCPEKPEVLTMGINYINDK